ncbi:hypothetical protein EFP05_11385 [Lactiplantibacillus pentosus]|nr:hypothetical protein CEW82_04470 [Lactiplantibacillus pentosus]MCS8603648.1 hypothetical protein [Lactiplantibacillus pentosus]MCT3066511.1 hypothetical protein [Lactiplantibacillus pentosus]MCT3277744.1 hypothetical protein [Lactiplantibacillus pentosus]MCT3308045.1 hypothetical protein [Lactiplantibacillus pentosus]
MKDQYLRRGFRLKSVSTTSRALPRMPGSWRRTRLSTSFTLTRFVSSGAQLAAFELESSML